MTQQMKSTSTAVRWCDVVWDGSNSPKYRATECGLCGADITHLDWRRVWCDGCMFKVAAALEAAKEKDAGD